MKKQINIVAFVTGFLLAPLALAETPKVGEIEKMSDIDPMSVTCSHESGRRGKTITGSERDSKKSGGGSKSGQAL